MGIVYEAVQLSLGRRVALKVLPFAAAFDARHLQRFRNEAQAAAQLHHTGIVPVYWVGHERGVHFYAMQLIEGQSLAVVIRQLRQQAGRSNADDSCSPAAPLPEIAVADVLTTSYRPAPSKEGRRKNEEGREDNSSPSSFFALPSSVFQSPAPETDSRLSLALSTQRSGKHGEFFRAVAGFMAQAAEALEHAHQFGIVHRDIKPANLLVDVHARLWITDFGLAQFHADAGLTQTGDILGTLRYMSPEQASGRRVVLDHRTDIYSLGATLYELVTLEPIFPGQNRQELLHQILEDEPRAPRALDRAVPVELETIVLKAVSKSPADRYGSAQEMAADLRRYLEDKPILARRPSLAERARKWSRRHPSVVAAGLLLLLVCIAGLVVNNRMIAKEQAKTAAALKREQQRFREAQDAVNFLVKVCEEDLADLPPPLQGVRQTVLERALNYYQDFIKDHQGDAGAQEDLEKGRERVQRILGELSTLQGAGQIVLMKNGGVQKDLQLKDRQKEQIARLTGNWDQQLQKHFEHRRGLPREEGRQEFLELARENEKALGEILKPEQLQRLGQIALQFKGPRAFHELDVARKLKLTDGQKQKIREIEGAAFAGMRLKPLPGPRKGGGPGGPHWPPGTGIRGGPGGHKGPLDECMRDASQRILEVLTLEQQQTWQELIGKPFEGARRGPPPFGSPLPFGPR
jgi:hypothetical protein